MSFLLGRPSASRGYTMVELMVVLTVLGVIVTIAIPSYRDHILRSRRMEVKIALFDIADKMLRFYHDNKSFTNDLVLLGYPSDPIITENGYYSIDVEDNGGGGGACPIAICFELHAVPLASQTADTECTEFVLNSRGEKTAEDGGGPTTGCW